jgi:hypothetical protein
MSEALQKIEQPPAPVIQSEGAALISMIERAARDPNIDIDKMERLFQMHAAAEARRAKTAYLAALATMQPELPVIEKNGEIARKAKGEDGRQQAAKATKYAKWEDIIEAINPILAKHGFSLSFRIKQETRVEVTAVLGHREGHSEETSMSLPIDDSGAKNNLQGWGSSVSYGKRYTAGALLNFVARGEDDDGNKGGDNPDNGAKVEDLNELLKQTSSNVGWFLQNFSVESLDDLTRKQREEMKAMLLAKKAKQMKAAKP